MTIAAGFVCSDGLVLAADTLYTGENKRQAAKLWLIPNGDGLIAIAGAGDGVLIKKARDEIERKLKPSMREMDIVQVVENVLHPLYVNHVQPDPYNMSLDLLIGIRTTAGCVLYENSGAAFAKVVKSQCIGCGRSLGLYFADSLFEEDMPIVWAQTIAAHLLNQTKEYARDCGGESHILSIPQSGEAGYLDPPQIDEIEKSLGTIQDLMRNLLLHKPSDPAHFDLLMGSLNAAVHATRRIRIQGGISGGPIASGPISG